MKPKLVDSELDFSQQDPRLAALHSAMLCIFHEQRQNDWFYITVLKAYSSIGKIGCS